MPRLIPLEKSQPDGVGVGIIQYSGARLASQSGKTWLWVQKVQTTTWLEDFASGSCCCTSSRVVIKLETVAKHLRATPSSESVCHITFDIVRVPFQAAIYYKVKGLPERLEKLILCRVDWVQSSRFGRIFELFKQFILLEFHSFLFKWIQNAICLTFFIKITRTKIAAQSHFDVLCSMRKSSKPCNSTYLWVVRH